MQHGTVLGGLDDALQGVVVLGGGGAPELGVLSLLRVQLSGQQLALRQHSTNGPCQAAVRDVLAGSRVGGQRSQPLAHGRHAGLGQEAVAVKSGLRNCEDRSLLQACGNEPAPQVGLDLALRASRYPVQDDGGRNVPLRRCPEVLPGNGVGVTCRCGDEDPHICTGQESGGQVPVVLHHGVDIGGVHDRQSLGKSLA